VFEDFKKKIRVGFCRGNLVCFTKLNISWEVGEYMSTDPRVKHAARALIHHQRHIRDTENDADVEIGFRVEKRERKKGDYLPRRNST